MLLPLSLLIGWTASAKEDNCMLAKTAGCAVVHDRLATLTTAGGSLCVYPPG